MNSPSRLEEGDTYNNKYTETLILKQHKNQEEVALDYDIQLLE